MAEPLNRAAIEANLTALGDRLAAGGIETRLVIDFARERLALPTTERIDVPRAIATAALLDVSQLVDIRLDRRRLGALLGF